MKCLGIDIGSFSVKVAELDASSKTYSLTGFYEIPLSLDPQADRQIQIVEILRNIANQFDIANTRFIIGIKQEHVSLRLKRFPFKERQKVLKSLAFELEDEIPLNAETSIFEAKILEYFGDAAEVLALACPTSVVIEALQPYQGVGIDPDIVSVEGLAAGNILESWNESVRQNPPVPVDEDGSPYAANVGEGRLLLHIGHEHTLVLVYRNGILIYARSLLWGGHDIAQAIARTFSVPYVEAINVLKTKSFVLMNSSGASKDQILLSNTIAQCLDQLTSELRLSILDLKAEHNLQFSQINLTGGVSQIQNLAPYLTQSLEIPANILHHFQSYPNVAFSTSAHNESVSPVAIGYAIEGIRKPRNPAMNMRKGDVAKQNQSMQVFWETWKSAVQIAVVAFVLLCIYGIIRDSFAMHLSQIAEEAVQNQAKKVANLKGSQASISGVERYINEQKKKIKVREELSKLDGYKSSLDIAGQITDKIPANVSGAKLALDVRKLVIDNDEVIIEGKVQNPQHLAILESSLKVLAIGGAIQKPQPTTPPGPGAGTPFAFRLTVNRNQ